jgi:hypothetical protein
MLDYGKDISHFKGENIAAEKNIILMLVLNRYHT